MTAGGQTIQNTHAMKRHSDLKWLFGALKAIKEGKASAERLPRAVSRIEEIIQDILHDNQELRDHVEMLQADLYAFNQTKQQ